jgi:hypothetical protein
MKTWNIDGVKRIKVLTTPEESGKLKELNLAVKEGRAALEATYFQRGGMLVAKQFVMINQKKESK